MGAAEVKKGSHPEPVRVRSAGGVVVKGSGDGLRVAVMQSRDGTWVLPKGGIEAGESPEEAAQREIAEEIGLTGAELLADIGATEHGYEQEGRQYRKQVSWFLLGAGPQAEVRPNADENVLDCGWFTPEQALRLLSHADQRRVLRRALSRLP